MLFLINDNGIPDRQNRFIIKYSKHNVKDIIFSKERIILEFEGIDDKLILTPKGGSGYTDEMPYFQEEDMGKSNRLRSGWMGSRPFHKLNNKVTQSKLRPSVGVRSIVGHKILKVKSHRGAIYGLQEPPLDSQANAQSNDRDKSYSRYYFITKNGPKTSFLVCQCANFLSICWIENKTDGRALF